MQCVILAGGLATRMRPLTDAIPKSLLRVLDRPFVDYQLRWLELQGIEEAVFCIGHKGELIQEHLATFPTSVKLKFVDEGEDLKGTAGALRLALDRGVLAERFLLTYGDSFLPISFRQVWETYLRNPEPGLMVVLKNEGRWDKSNARFEDGKVSLYDKSNDCDTLRYIDYGLSALSADVIEHEVVAGKKQDLAGVFHNLSKRGTLRGWETMQRFYEIGSPEGLADFVAFARNQLKTFFDRDSDPSFFIPPVEPWSELRR